MIKFYFEQLKRRGMTWIVAIFGANDIQSFLGVGLGHSSRNLQIELSFKSPELSSFLHSWAAGIGKVKSLLFWFSVEKGYLP